MHHRPEATGQGPPLWICVSVGGARNMRSVENEHNAVAATHTRYRFAFRGPRRTRFRATTNQAAGPVFGQVSAPAASSTLSATRAALSRYRLDSATTRTRATT